MIFNPFKSIESFSDEVLFPERVDTNGDGIEDSNFKDPHWVEGYERADGTYVESYYRDGDDDCDTILDKSEGGGYYAHDPGECDCDE